MIFTKKELFFNVVFLLYTKIAAAETIGQIGLLDADAIQKIGQMIWQNEASGKEELLVFWNKNEPFPSLGIGHNIWFPTGYNANYSESFPLLCDYLKKHGVVLPPWLEKARVTGAPWKSREEFYQDTLRTQELRQLLVKTIPLQTQFMIDRMVNKLPKIIEAAPQAQRHKVVHTINLLRSTPLGTYCLVDYLNFKGDGLNSREANKGKRWGLLAVLLDMPGNLTQSNITKAFYLSAAKKLLQRIENSGPGYDHIIFLEGWFKRLSTYIELDKR